MISYFPKYFSNRAITAFIFLLFIVSILFMGNALSFQYVLFGIIAIIVFFFFGTRLSANWLSKNDRKFKWSLYITALLLRLGYVIFVYYYYIENTGIPHAFGAADEKYYEYMGSLWVNEGFSEFVRQTTEYADLSDRGYCWWLAIEKVIFGNYVLPSRIIKCFFDAGVCVLIYNLAKRNFGESTGRMAAIFCMLMPNFWYYCGVSLKETEMTFLTVLFVERTDYLLRMPKIRLKNVLLPVIIPLLMFTFRTVLAVVLLLALGATLILSSQRQMKTWKKIMYVLLFTGLVVATIRVEMIQEVQDVWEGRTESQETGLQWRAEREGGNAFARYAGAAVFAPLIFTIPFPTIVDISGQENQMMLCGANFVKNIMSGFTIFALFLLLFRKEWRKHVLPLAVMIGYLVVLVFSNFAQSERFHFPALPFELMFAAYGISQCTKRQKVWFNIWLFGICIANIGWAWFKLAGRGLA